MTPLSMADFLLDLREKRQKSTKMEIRRFKDIIAIKSYNTVVQSDSVVAFHASNIEVAELSPESFNEMTEISLKSGEIPSERAPLSLEAYEALSSWNLESNDNVKSGKMDFGIRSLTINVNQICNLKCTYCAAGGDGTYGEPNNQISVERTLPQLKYFITSLKPNTSFAISFVGGEPLLHPQAIKAIHTYVSSECLNRQITPIMKIVTNGTLIKGEALDILRSMKIHLTISFDGAKEKNDLMRPSKDGKSTTEKIIHGLNSLAKDRGLIESIGFSAIITQENSNLIENYNFLKSFNPDSVEFVFANDEKSEEVQSSFISQMNEIAAIAWKEGGENELRKIKSFDHYFHVLDNQQKTENFCGAGKNYLMVDAKNHLYSCVWDVNNKEEMVGHGEQLDQASLAKYSKPLIELNNCQTCWARHMCGGGCMYINKAHSGNKHQKNIMFCERIRNLILTSIMYYKLARASDADALIG